MCKHSLSALYQFIIPGRMFTGYYLNQFPYISSVNKNRGIPVVISGQLQIKLLALPED